MTKENTKFWKGAKTPEHNSIKISQTFKIIKTKQHTPTAYTKLKSKNKY